MTDRTPPTITCPADLDVLTDEGKPYKEVSFNQPTVADNSDAMADAEVTVTQHPSSVKSPHKFPINTTTVVFIAADPSNNKHSCTFRVSVKGALYIFSTNTNTYSNNNNKLYKSSWHSQQGKTRSYRVLSAGSTCNFLIIYSISTHTEDRGSRTQEI